MTAGARFGLDSLTAVVLNWNQADLAIRSVEALVDDGMPPARIVVVDNGSTDGSWSASRRRFDTVDACASPRTSAMRRATTPVRERSPGMRTSS